LVPRKERALRSTLGARHDRERQRSLAGARGGRTIPDARGTVRPKSPPMSPHKALVSWERRQASRSKLARWRQPSCLPEQGLPSGGPSLRGSTSSHAVRSKGRIRSSKTKRYTCCRLIADIRRPVSFSGNQGESRDSARGFGIACQAARRGG
jgi:hypothetical protein